MKINDKDIDVVNGWILVEKKDWCKGLQPMKQYYDQIELLLGPFKRYTKAV